MVRILGENSKQKCLGSTAHDRNKKCLLVDCLIRGEIPEPQETAAQASKTDRNREKVHTPQLLLDKGGQAHVVTTVPGRGKEGKALETLTADCFPRQTDSRGSQTLRE